MISINPQAYGCLALIPTSRCKIVISPLQGPIEIVGEWGPPQFLAKVVLNVTSAC